MVNETAGRPTAVMRTLLCLFIAVLAALAATSPGRADPLLIEDFRMQAETRWRFFTDGVMGGTSTGQVVIVTAGGVPHARMTGHVSTANNGGFIQMRHELDAPPPEGASGLRLVVRGNGQRYFVHLRTAATILPWQYYQAPFEVTADWAEVRLPYTAFRASGRLLPEKPDPRSLRSLAIVAYGRDHEVEIEVREVGFY